MRYKIDPGMLAFILHRLSGLALLVYLILHIQSMSYLAIGPEHFNEHMLKFNTPFFKVAEICLFAPIIFHALNGIRIILVDLFDLTKYQRQMFYVALVLSFVLWVVVAYFMFQHADVLQAVVGGAKGGGH